jgi:hypothetical protein
VVWRRSYFTTYFSNVHFWTSREYKLSVALSKSMYTRRASVKKVPAVTFGTGLFVGP